MTTIRGAGGGKGGGSGRVAVEAPDTLRSIAYARILDAVSEGEIEGLVDGAKSVYFDDVPLQNADGSYNFSGITLDTRTGTQGQGYIQGFPSVESETAVGVKVTAATSVTRSFTNSALNAVYVKIGIPQLTEQNTGNGDINGAEVRIVIDLQTASGGYVPVWDDTIKGKTTSRYQRSYAVKLSGSGPWDIRVRRITADSTSVALQDDVWWDSYTETIFSKLRYPNTALVGIGIDSSQFQNIPRRGYDCKLLRVQIPSNYNPVTRTYTGTWSGTFTTAWTDNPAWCFYDLLTNARYGLGEFVPAAQVDKWALYTIGQYCDELVSNGFGGTEPRFTCNAYLQTREDAYKVMQDLASVFRAMVFWAAGNITAVQDSPATAAYLYTPANVIDGVFTYTGSSRRARHTVALVAWNDPADLYRQKIEYVEDTAGIARYGVVTTQVTAFACTSRGQAARLGRWLLFSERLQSEAVAFSVGLDGAICRPGQVIKIADPARAGVRMGGRIVSATTGTVTLDAPVTLAAATTYTLGVVSTSGTVMESTVTTGAGTVSALSVSPAFASAPEAQAVWILRSATADAQEFRVIAVTEDERNVFTINALGHDAGKYAAVESGLTLTPRSISVITAVPAAPTGGTITENLYEAPTDLKTQVTFAWTPSAGATNYMVSYRRDAGNFIDLPPVGVPSAQLMDAQPGVYDVRVVARNALDMRSTALTFSGTVYGKTAPPADVTGLQVFSQGGSGLLTWDAHPDLDVRIGGKIVVRHTTADTPAAAWNTSIPIAEFGGAATSGAVPLISGTYLVKALDSVGLYSTNAATTGTTVANLLRYNVLATVAEEPAFDGAKTNLSVVSGQLQLAQTIDFDSIADLDAYTDPIDSGIQPSGSYVFANMVDLGGIYSVRVTATVTSTSYDVANFVDGWTAVDSVTNVDGSLEGDTAGVTLYVATTRDPPGGSPVWSDWRVFNVGEYSARGMKFYLDMARGALPSQQVTVSALDITVDTPDRVEAGNSVAVGTGGLNVAFAAPFFAVPAITATPEDMATGDYAVITGKSVTGFTIAFRDSAGNPVARTIDWIAKGYGLQQ